MRGSVVTSLMVRSLRARKSTAKRRLPPFLGTNKTAGRSVGRITRTDEVRLEQYLQLLLQFLEVRRKEAARRPSGGNGGLVDELYRHVEVRGSSGGLVERGGIVEDVLVAFEEAPTGVVLFCCQLGWDVLLVY